ncbi:hypothetical protein, partial [Actinobaculum suis]|uniref:hypothetical protein n=1 Tax=Actinobaculum suis TaxID=1657 RepID=UPI0018CD5818
MDASVNNFSEMIVTEPAASEMNLGELLENRGNLVVALLMLVFSLLSIIASILLWLVLVIRDNLLYVCVVALPLAFSGLAWSGSANWPKKILKWILALAFCKIGIVVLLGMGSTALASATSSDAAFTTRASAMLSFVALSTIGGFMPFVAFKFFDFVGGEFEMARVTQDVIDSGRGAVSAVSGANESLSNALQSANSGSGSSG